MYSRGRAEDVIIQADSLHKLLAGAGAGAGAGDNTGAERRPEEVAGLTERRAEELISAIRAGRRRTLSAGRRLTG
jgi:hypothetical protein